jgi:hypothetical protein
MNAHETWNLTAHNDIALEALVKQCEVVRNSARLVGDEGLCDDLAPLLGGLLELAERRKAMGVSAIVADVIRHKQQREEA